MRHTKKAPRKKIKRSMPLGLDESTIRIPRGSQSGSFDVGWLLVCWFVSGYGLSHITECARRMRAAVFPDSTNELSWGKIKETAIAAPKLRPGFHLYAELLDFLVVVLAVKNIPLLRTFEDGPFLALDLLAGGYINPFFMVEQFLENLAGLLPNRVGVFDELDFVELFEHVRHGPREDVDFVAAQPHSTALYFRTNSVFTLRNISW